MEQLDDLEQIFKRPPKSDHGILDTVPNTLTTVIATDSRPKNEVDQNQWGCEMSSPLGKSDCLKM